MADLDFNNMWQSRAIDNRDIELKFDVFAGMAYAKIFGKEGLIKRIRLTPYARQFMVTALRRIRQDKPGASYSISLLNYEKATNTKTKEGTLMVTRDERGFYLGVSAPGMSPAKFQIRAPLSYDVSPGFTPEEATLVALDELIKLFDARMEQACNLTSEKREWKGGPGGQRQGGGQSQFGGGGDGGGRAPSASRATVDDEILF